METIIEWRCSGGIGSNCAVAGAFYWTMAGSSSSSESNVVCRILK